MHIKKSIECWVIDTAQQKALLLRVPAKKGVAAFNQPITGGIEGVKTPTDGCIREVFEETGHHITPQNLHHIKSGFKIIVHENFHLDKTVFLYKTPVFYVILSPTEHESSQWVDLDKVEHLLTYPSNKQTFAWVKEFLKD